MVTLSADGRITAGILLLTIVGIEYGGWFLMTIARGRVPATDFQKTFFRAGHAHAGVLVTLGLVCQILADATRFDGFLATVARSGVPLAAVLIPAGFFFAATGKNVTKPNAFITLIYAGIAVLAVGVVALGFGLLTA